MEGRDAIARTQREPNGATPTKHLRRLDVVPNLIPPGCQAITPQMLPLVDLAPEHIERIVQAVPGGSGNVQDIYPLSPLQEGLLFHHVLERQRDVYVVSTLLELQSRSRLDAFVEALEQLIDRHDVLRTAVLWEGLPRPVQVVCRRVTLSVTTVETLGDPVGALRNLTRPEQQRMDMQRAPLVQLHVAADSDNLRWYALLQLHHVICDGQSLQTIVAEVMARVQGRAGLLPAPLQYRTHVAQVLAHAGSHEVETFFRTKLGSFDEPSAPFGLLDVRDTEAPVEELRQGLEPTLARRIRAEASRLHLTTAAVMHAAWALVVARTSQRDDVVFGTVLFGRLQASGGTRQAVGLFLNTLPLRLQLESLTARSLVEQAQRELFELLKHEQASLAVAQRCSGVAAPTPLFSTLLNYRHKPRNPDTQWTNAASGIRMLASRSETTYPLVLSIDDFGDDFDLIAQTVCGIDAGRVLGYTQTALRSLLDALEQNSEIPALALSVLPRSERNQVVEVFNATEAPYPADRSVHELFEEQVMRTPAAVAVVYEGQALTYSQLNGAANRLARHLIEQGMQVGEYVPIVMSRCLEMLVAQLAILKCGGVYVPLDPGLPKERQQFITQDCGARRVILEGTVGTERGEPTENLQPIDVKGTSPAYVMYTSGSSGVPKGVVVPHRAVSRLVINNGYAQIEPTDCLAHCSNPSFDASTLEIWGALLNGASVLIVPQLVVLDAERLAETLESHHVTVLWLTAGLFTQYKGPLATVFRQLRYLIVGGDVVEPRAVKQVLRDSAPAHFLNGYGPTECTTFSTTYRIDAIDDDTRSIPIGRPISNARVYILDRRMQPAPIGVVGEIYIGGDGVALGYLNRPELTGERFVQDPFSQDPRARLYKTGDLGSWREDGTVEYRGRNDHQVKVRGFRIELEEIEAHLVRHAQVKEALVVALADGPIEKRLVAYVVLRDSTKMADVPAQLRTHLSGALPEYMVPSAFVTLERFPLTANGKFDRRALPLPEISAYASRQYEPPRGEVEEILAGIWQELLRVDHIGRADNFFELGGHSLLIVPMMERLRRVGLTAQIRRVFESPTLADLATVLTNETEVEFPVPPNGIPAECQLLTPEMLPLVRLTREEIERIVLKVPGGAANIQDIYPLAPLQEGMLFHHLLHEHRGDTYLVTTVLSVPSRDKLDELIAALQKVIERHDALRTVVLWEQLPQPLQVVYRHATLPVQELAWSQDRELPDQIRDWIKPQRHRLDLQRALPIKLYVVPDERDGRRWYALLQVHHLVNDAVSLKILIAEAIAHLEKRESGLPRAVPYRNHVAQALAHSRTQDSKSFFREKLRDIDEPTAPFGLIDVHGDGSHIGEAREEFAPGLARRMRAQARRLGVSMATIFHAAWALVIAHTSGRDDVVFGSVLLGRLQGSAGAQRILGMFINTLPLRFSLHGVSARRLVENAQRELIGLFSHEQASLADAQRCSGIVGAAPLFSALLNYRYRTASADEEWSGAADIEVVARQYRTNYPIALSVDDLGEGFAMTAQTDRGVDPRRLLGYVTTAIESLTEALESEPDKSALALSILPANERDQLIEAFNATTATFPHEKLIHELFEEQVARSPDAVAVVDDDQSLTYAELNRRANRLARYLRERGVGPDQPVALCVERGVEMVVGQLGILKAGGAYVSLDPDYPADRLQYMLADASPRVLLTQEAFRTRFAHTATAVVTIDGDWTEIAQRPAADLQASAMGLRSDHLAYVIYTSGSTGQPKGVAIEHKSAVNLIWWAHSAMGDEVFRQTLQSTSLNFDLSVYECFVPLTTGGRLRVVQNALALVASPVDVTLINTVPSAIAAILDSGEIPHSTRAINLAGEVLTGDLTERIFANSTVEQVCNLYGPTETTTYSTWIAMSRSQGFCASIGRPIANTQVYIVNRHLRPVPIGVAGEIYIGGAGVARGYLNRPELTAERFMRNPFQADPQARVYRTGDLGRWRADGTIEYLGRLDHQVKIRGYRIELGEIEAQIRRHPMVKDAVVLAREDVPGDKRLVAYVVGERSSAADQSLGQVPQKLRNEVLNEWVAVWQETYAKDDPVAGPSFVGWNSSYTGEPIPENEMREWLACTVERLDSLKPKRVLEIGCGTGLVLQHLAPRCEAYLGTDISMPGLEQLGRWISQREDLQHVSLLHRSAMELQDLESASFDTVVLNSVVQYFPDIEYLLAVVREAVRLVSAGGRVFIGDVRHFGLLPVFHSAVQLSKAAATVNIGQLQKRVGRALAQEKELVIDPEFFQLLPNNVPGISAADVQLKRGQSGNELTRYRYDVVLHVDAQTLAVPEYTTLEWGKGIDSIAELETGLRERRWSALRLQSVPNLRVARDAAAHAQIESDDERMSASTLRRRLSEMSHDGYDPEMFWQLGSAQDFDVALCWDSSQSHRHFSVHMQDRLSLRPVTVTPPDASAARRPWTAYANDPLEHSLRQQLVPELRQYVKQNLPEYMLPSAWMVLKQLPLTPSGKVDRAALPVPHGRAEEFGEYVAPGTELERGLATLWAQVLQVDQVGVNDNFFEIGGHSLLGMKIFAQLGERLGIRVPVVSIYQYPTIRQMAPLVESLLLTVGAQSALSGVTDVEEGLI